LSENATAAPGGQQTVVKLLGPLGRQMSTQKGPNVLGLGAQHVGQHLRVVAVAGESGFEPVKVRRQRVGHGVGVNWSGFGRKHLGAQLT